MSSFGVIPFRRNSLLWVFCITLSFLCSMLFFHRPHYFSPTHLETVYYPFGSDAWPGVQGAEPRFHDTPAGGGGLFLRAVAEIQVPGNPQGGGLGISTEEEFFPIPPSLLVWDSEATGYTGN